MLAGHLMLSVMTAMTAFAVSLLAGQPWWAAFLIYAGAGTLSLVGSTAVAAWRLPEAPAPQAPTRKGAGRPGAPRSRSGRSRPVQAGSASRALPAMAAKASGSWTARSASTLRSTSMPASDRPLMKRE